MRTSRIAAVATLLALSVLTACGGDGDDESDSSDDKTTVTVTETPTETTSAPTETTPTIETSVTPMDPTEGDVTQEQIEAALLTPEEVSPDFVLGAYTDESSPPLCDPDGTPVDEAFPPSVQGGTQIDHADGIAALQEEIVIYASEAEAAEAFAFAVAGLACAEGSVDGTPVTIGAPQDVTAQVNSSSGIGASTAWEVSTDGFNGVIVATLAGQIILATQFASAPDADTSAFPAPLDVAAAAFAKALAN